MKNIEFIAIGEKVHCSRLCKVGGEVARVLQNGTVVIRYMNTSGYHEMPVPEQFVPPPNSAKGQLRPCVAAIWQGLYGTEGSRPLAVSYLQSLVRLQGANGAAYIDLNVDEFSSDIKERIKAMIWLVEKLRETAKHPFSIDSSSGEVLAAGLAACKPGGFRPLLNSVSLERAEAIELARKYNAQVVASAAGEKSLPHNQAERLANLEKLIPRLKAIGLADEDIFIDPLVFPIATDGNNGKSFLESVKAIRERFGKKVHITAGISNVSYGMPQRKLINQVFAYLAVEAGGDSGIVDPAQISAKIIEEMDTQTRAFQLARALLMGEDDFGMEFITACREGEI